MTGKGIYSARCLIITILALASLLQGCAGMGPGYETPTVTISSFRSLPSQGALPSFEIGLHVINPNREPLNLIGAVYTVNLDGHELIKGVANELPVIEAYGEGSFMLTGSPNLIAGIRFLTGLAGESKESVRYELEARLDGGAFRRRIRVQDSGEISLR
jgi:LEA14-like dessication related protein